MSLSETPLNVTVIWLVAIAMSLTYSVALKVYPAEVALAGQSPWDKRYSVAADLAADARLMPSVTFARAV